MFPEKKLIMLTKILIKIKINLKTNNTKITVVGSKVRDKAARVAEIGHSVAS